MADDELAAIAALIADGDERNAFARLRGRLAWPQGREVGELAPWLAVLADLATRRGASMLADLASAARDDPDSPDRLYDLGYALIDADVPAIAATVLWRCLSLVGESEEVVCELVSALETALAYGDAFAVLEQRPELRARSFLCSYLYAFNAAMIGRIEVTRAALAALAPDSPETEAMRDTIAAIVERADRVAGACTLDDHDLRGWHYVLTGGLVTHLSPYGFDEPMRGRYAWLQDSAARIATGIDRLAPLARGLPCVYAPPGRGHEILARAVATRLALPLVPWPVIGVPAPGLVAIYDLTEVAQADLARLVQRKADQLVFAHGSPWTRDFPITPDVTTLLCQTLIPPWGETTLVDPGTRAVRQAPADARDPDAIAAEVAASPGLDASEVVADAPASWQALVDRAWPPRSGTSTRSRLWAGGPVASNRFD